MLCIAVPLLSSCQIYSVVKDATDHEEGRVVMKDGTEYLGRVKMPKCNTQTIRIKTEDGQKLKLKNTDIAVLGVWKRRILTNVIFLCAIHMRQLKCSLPKRRKL